MPPFERMGLIHDAVLWSKVGIGQRGQRVVSSIPQDIKVRFLTKTAVIQDVNGNNIRTDGSVMLQDDVVEGDILWAGTIDDLSGTGTSPPTSGLMEVVGFNSDDDLKGRNAVRMAMLMRFNSVLPIGS